MEMVQGQSQRKEVPDAGNDAPEQSGGTRVEEIGRTILSAQDRPLPHRTIPEVDEKLGHSGVRMVSVQDANERTPVQALRQMEEAAKGPVGRGTEGDREREESLHNP